MMLMVYCINHYVENEGRFRVFGFSFVGMVRSLMCCWGFEVRGFSRVVVCCFCLITNPRRIWDPWIVLVMTTDLEVGLYVWKSRGAAACFGLSCVKAELGN
ncbi:hypothetical protein Droror1_Dr00018037 [Drosera rotundifolia]